MSGRRVAEPTRATKQERRNMLHAGLTLGFAAFLMLSPMVFIFAGTPTLNIYNRDHPAAIQCDVQRAEAKVSSSRSTRGIGSSHAQVVFVSKECGRMNLTRGVGFANYEDVAASIKPGRYAINVGQGTLNVHSLFQLARINPTVLSYEKVG